MIPPPGSRGDQCSIATYIDPRDTTGFRKIDHLVSSFIPSFPKSLKSATQGGVVDVYLIVAFLAPNVYVFFLLTIETEAPTKFISRAKILLHDPHADLKRKGCVSVTKIFEAAHAILEQLYALWSTSFDLCLLDNFCSVCLFSESVSRLVLNHSIY